MEIQHNDGERETENSVTLYRHRLKGVCDIQKKYKVSGKFEKSKVRYYMEGAKHWWENKKTIALRRERKTNVECTW